MDQNCFPHHLQILEFNLTWIIAYLYHFWITRNHHILPGFENSFIFNNFHICKPTTTLVTTNIEGLWNSSYYTPNRSCMKKWWPLRIQTIIEIPSILTLSSLPAFANSSHASLRAHSSHNVKICPCSRLRIYISCRENPKTFVISLLWFITLSTAHYSTNHPIFPVWCCIARCNMILLVSA